MTRYQASFEIDSKTDSYAARRILERVYDTVQEESKSVRAGSEDADELLDAFRTLRDATEPPSPGTLTIVFERDDDAEFEDR
jgi:hypothetical protein